MAKQPEQILEEQLLEQNKVLSFFSAPLSHFKVLKINSIKNLTLKMLTEFKKGITVVSTVLATLKSVRTAYQGESYAFIGVFQPMNTPLRLILNHIECINKCFFHLLQFPKHALQ